GSSQDCAYARYELVGIEWLRQIIVGSHFEASDAVMRVAASGKHQYRNARVLADSAEHIETIGIRPHHIQQTERVLIARPAVATRDSPEDPIDGEPFVRKEAGNEAGQFRIVIDHQKAFHDGKTISILGPPDSAELSRCVKTLTVLDTAWHF